MYFGCCKGFDKIRSKWIKKYNPVELREIERNSDYGWTSFRIKSQKEKNVC